MRKVLYFMAWHILTQGRYRAYKVKFRIEAKARRSQLNFEGFDTLWYAGQMVSLMDSLFFVHASKYMYVPTSSQPASQPIQLHKKNSSSWIVHDRISTVCSKVVNTTQRRTCIHAFQVVFQHATKCFNKLCLVCYLVSFVLSPSVSPLPARSIWRWLHRLSVRS